MRWLQEYLMKFYRLIWQQLTYRGLKLLLNISLIIKQGKMQEFKNPFDELEDHVINLTDSSLAQINEEEQKKVAEKIKGQPSSPLKQKPNELDQTIQMNTPRQEGIIQNNNYDGQQTIFMRKGDTYGSRASMNQDDDPPLLQDIGINPELVVEKILSIVKFEKPTQRYIEEPDLSGPLLIGFLFGMLLLLSGKVHFGDIYALFVIGNILLFFLINLMSKKQPISLYGIMSTLGYCLVPMLIVALFGVLFSLKNGLGIILSLGLSVWCAYSATNFIQLQMGMIQNDRWPLILYPIYLYYVSFALITIF